MQETQAIDKRILYCPENVNKILSSENTLIIFYKNNFIRTWGSENFLIKNTQ